jgi:hypothetical protein
MHEGMLGVARDSVHMLDDGFSTLALRPHYQNNVNIAASGPGSGCNIENLTMGVKKKKRATYTTPRTCGGFAQSPFKMGATSAPASCNDVFEGAGTYTWGIYL